MKEVLKKVKELASAIETAMVKDAEVTTGDTLISKNYDDRELTVCCDTDRKEFFLVRTGDHNTFNTINSKRVKSETGKVKLADLFDKPANAKHYEIYSA